VCLVLRLLNCRRSFVDFVRMVCCLLLVLLPSAANYFGPILTLQVEPKARECFYEEVVGGQQFSMDFEVVRGGLLDIKLTILDPQNQVAFEKMSFFNRPDDALNEQEGRVLLPSTIMGVYQICFDNTMSRFTAKVVSFRINSGGKKEELVKFEHLTPMVDSVIKISEELNKIEHLQHHLRVREQSHRDASESTNARVQWMAIVESALLVSMSIFQLNYIRRWFAESDGKTRV